MIAAPYMLKMRLRFTLTAFMLSQTCVLPAAKITTTVLNFAKALVGIS